MRWGRKHASSCGSPGRYALRGGWGRLWFGERLSFCPDNRWFVEQETWRLLLAKQIRFYFIPFLDCVTTRSRPVPKGSGHPHVLGTCPRRFNSCHPDHYFRASRAGEAEQGLKKRTRIIATMLLTITTTHIPATDLGYLLHKNPAKLHSLDLSFGKAHVLYPEAT